MATDIDLIDLVVIQKSYLNCLRSHCNLCPSLSDQQRAFLRESPVEIPYEPSLSKAKRKATQKPPGNGKSKLLKSGKRQTTQLRARDSFVNSIPKTSQWRSRQESIVGELKNYEGIVRSLSSCSNVGPTRQPNQEVLESCDHLVVVGKNLALLTDASLRTNDSQRSFSYFQAFLFLSYCGLLESRGIPYDVVDRITQCVSSFREVDRRKLRRQALKVNDLIQRLVDKGWNIHRATELFFLNPLSPSSLLNVNEEGFWHICETLTTKEYLEYEFGDCFRPEYTIPGLIVHMIHEADTSTTISTDEICAGLQYKDIIIPEPLDHILRVQDSIHPKANAPVSFEFVTNTDCTASTTPSQPRETPQGSTPATVTISEISSHPGGGVDNILAAAALLQGNESIGTSMTILDKQQNRSPGPLFESCDRSATPGTIFQQSQITVESGETSCIPGEVNWHETGGFDLGCKSGANALDQVQPILDGKERSLKRRCSSHRIDAMAPEGSGGTSRKRRFAHQVYDRRTNGNNIESGFDDTRSATVVAVPDNATQPTHYTQRHLETPGSSTTHSIFHPASHPSVAPHPNETDLVQMDSSMPIHNAMSTLKPGLPDQNEIQYSTTVAEDTSEQWSFLDDMEMVRPWPFLDDMGMVRSWPSKEDVEMIQSVMQNQSPCFDYSSL